MRKMGRESSKKLIVGGVSEDAENGANDGAAVLRSERQAKKKEGAH